MCIIEMTFPATTLACKCKDVAYEAFANQDGESINLTNTAKLIFNCGGLCYNTFV